LMAKAAKVDDLPARKWKSPLQEAIQILKRHRDMMFQDAPDSAPILASINVVTRPKVHVVSESPAKPWARR
jgi:hypothetical protein